MLFLFIGYVLVSGALTFLVPYWSIKPDAAFPAAFAGLELHWIKYLVSVGALCGMTTTLFGSLYSLPRCIYAMADDGLVFKFLAKVNKKTQVHKYINNNILLYFFFHNSFKII
jgi:cationic amino acid transporter 4